MLQPPWTLSSPHFGITMTLISRTSRILRSCGGCVSFALHPPVCWDPLVFLPVPLSSSGLRHSFHSYRCYQSQVETAAVRVAPPTAARFLLVCLFYLGFWGGLISRFWTRPYGLVDGWPGHRSPVPRRTRAPPGSRLIKRCRFDPRD